MIEARMTSDQTPMRRRRESLPGAAAGAAAGGVATMLCSDMILDPFGGGYGPHHPMRAICLAG